MKTKSKNKKKEDSPSVKKAMLQIVEAFKTGNVPAAISIAMFPRLETPSCSWSLSNRMLMAFNGSYDARGFQQWKAAGRKVKKGEKAFYILGPKMKKIKKKDEEGQEKEETFLLGFFGIPVFSASQTEGKPIDYESIPLPNFPLLERAKEWGIKVNSTNNTGEFRARYFIEDERIELCTPHEKSFFHELAHAAHKRVKGGLEGGQNPQQEIVAELAAQVLCQMVGKELKSSLGNSYEYIKGYAKELGKSPEKACLSVLSETEKVLNLILKKD